MSLQPNAIYCGDCKEVLGHFPENCIDLIYLDPPFFSNKNYEVIGRHGYKSKAFEDKWKGGINNYIGWMKERVSECFRVLKETGCMFLHCDWHAGHYLKVMADSIFRDSNLRNEIVWHYRTGGVSKKWFARKHDTIFFYSKGNKYTFNPIEVKKYYTEIYGPDFKPGWEDRNGGKDEGGHFRFAYLDDVWDIPAVFNMSKEFQGYPTQKPEALLERIITAGSNPKDIVLDPFCGCGTAISVAHKLCRRWIGIDVSPTACKLMSKRLKSIGVKGLQIVGLPRTVVELRKLEPFEFQNRVR